MFFCTQLPTDIPNAVLSQLGARVQHALRAFTPEDQAALAKTVKTYPNTKDYDIEEALTSLGTGEAIVTVLSERGRADAGGVDADAGAALADGRADRRRRHRGGAGVAAARQVRHDGGPRVGLRAADGADRRAGAALPKPQYVPPPPAYEPEPERREREEPGFLEKAFGSPVVKSFLRSAATQLGREVTRGIFGTRTRSRTTTRRRR